METVFATPRPRPALTPYLRALHGARVTGGAAERQLELPVAGTAVILAIEHPWWVAAKEGAPLVRHGSFAGGLTLGPAVAGHGGEYDLVELVLTPAGTAAVLGVPAAELAGLVVELGSVLGLEADRLVERLAALPGWDARFAATEAWLQQRIARRPDPLRPDVAWALACLDASAGRVPIGALQAGLGCSRRHLATRFAEAVGTTPKAYAQLVRFTRAAAQLRGGRRPAEVAAACGYTDQAHLTRAVRRFGATTPGALGRGFPALVTSMQDGGAVRA